MEELKRFDIAVHGDVAMVIIESDLLPPDPAVVVIPLLPDYPAVRHLNPMICRGGRNLILATRLIAAVHRSALRHVGTAEEQGDEITRAIDVLMGGFLNPFGQQANILKMYGHDIIGLNGAKVPNRP